jgi:4-hydroxybenzoate polyprenyltransferase
MTDYAPPARPVTALIRASHPEPTVAVTAFALILAGVARNDAGTVFTVGLAVLFGQLVIGWSNDRLDVGRDAAAGRADKPLATGDLSPGLVDGALAVAAAGALVCSFALGWRAGAASVWVVGWGVAYNLGLKATVASWVPYALAFGALPAVATLALYTPRWPPLWVIGAGALLGVAANLTNALPDLVDDAHTGVRGLPHRLGARRSLLLAAALLCAVTALVVFGPMGAPRPVSWCALVAVPTVVLIGLRSALRAPASRVSFIGILAITTVNLVLLVATAGGLR